MTHIAYKFRLNPTASQEVVLNSWTGSARTLYNFALEHRNLNYMQFKKSIGYHEQAAALKEIKKLEGFEWIGEVPAQTLQQVLMDLDGGFKKFFKGQNKYPNFKKKSQGIGLRFPDPKQFKITKINRKNGSISLPKGLDLRFKLSRVILGTVKSATLKKEGGHWFVSILCEKELRQDQNSNPKSEIGIDRGISESMVCSNGEIFNLPSSAKTNYSRIKVLQKRMRNKKKFSKNWHKDQVKIRKAHSKITNIRKDFLHKTSTYLTKNHGLIVMEDLKIKNMSRSAKGSIENPGKSVGAKSGLNREILFQGWGMFASMVDYKTRWNGGRMEIVNPRFTSQRCSVCLYQHKENRKGKEFLCLNCGHQEDADLNAAKNIKNTVGQTGSDCGGVSVSSACETVTSGKRTRKSA